MWAIRCGYDGDGRDGEFRLLGFIEGFAPAFCSGHTSLVAH
jgi:hypothetical protein